MKEKKEQRNTALKSSVALKGSQKDSYVLEIKDKKKLYDIQMTHEELLELIKILKRKKLC